MVSDVLFEAQCQIEAYLTPPSIYEGEARAKIERLRDHMDEVRAYLDTPPGTKQETVSQNNA